MHEMAAVYGSPEIIANYQAETYRLQYQVDSINSLLGKNVDMEKSRQRLALQQRIADLQQVLQYREGACVYGSPEIIQEYGEETRRLRQEVEDLNEQLRKLDE